MLDKALTYHDIIMKLRSEKIAAIPEPKLPEGYAFDFYHDGDEEHWARLESSVLEFPSPEKALAYFNREYRDPFRRYLYRRCVFVKDPNGRPVATTTAWFAESSLGHRGWLQWIATDPEHQGLGLGRAVIARALRCFPEVEPGSDIYLHTQTWSHKAIFLYHQLGFEFFTIDHVKMAWDNPDGFLIMHNSPEATLKELEKIYTPELIASLRNHIEHPTEYEKTDFPPAEGVIKEFVIAR